MDPALTNVPQLLDPSGASAAELSRYGRLQCLLNVRKNWCTFGRCFLIIFFIYFFSKIQLFDPACLEKMSDDALVKLALDNNIRIGRNQIRYIHATGIGTWPLIPTSTCATCCATCDIFFEQQLWYFFDNCHSVFFSALQLCHYVVPLVIFFLNNCDIFLMWYFFTIATPFFASALASRLHMLRSLTLFGDQLRLHKHRVDAKINSTMLLQVLQLRQ